MTGKLQLIWEERPDGRWGLVPREEKGWVGLTKDEVATWDLPERPTVFEFVQFVEAKLKEKNSA